jgi:hypothetical protein
MVEVLAMADADGASTPNAASLTLSNGSSDPAANFCYQRAHPHSISGTLYYDANSNGTRDANEPAMTSVRVTLAVDANSDGTVDSTISTTTSSSGSYSFTSLYSGSYQLRVDTTGFPADVVPVSDADGAATVNSVRLVITPGQSDPTGMGFTFRRLSPHVVTGTLFYDLNSNGSQESGEGSIGNARVSLAIDANSDGTVDSTISTTTSSSGSYSFSGLYAGRYTVKVDTTTLPEVASIADADGISTPSSASLTLQIGGTDPRGNFTYRRLTPHVVSGIVYYDADSNAVQDTGEPGIPTVTVRLAVDVNNDGVTDTTLVAVTDINGSYRFANLSAGRYTLRIDSTTLADDVIPTADPDGISTVSTASMVLQRWASDGSSNFAYRRLNPPGTGTRGYWVNHPSAWPVSCLYLGSTLYTKAQALTVLQRATKGDMTYAMAAQLIAAKLNLYNGNQSSCIGQTVSDADTWMTSHGVGSGVTGGSSAWSTGSPLHNDLDDYNNGRLCAEHIN